MNSKRQFTNFHKFPGKYDDGQDLHHMGELTYLTSKKKKTWSIFIRMIKAGKKITKIDWNLLSEVQVPLKAEYYTLGTKIDKGIVAEVWVETGYTDGKLTRMIPSYFDKPVLVGRKNERNCFQQAMIFARSQYLKTYNKHIKTVQKNKLSTSMYFPMLAAKEKDGRKHIKFPAIVQPKYNGTRAITTMAATDKPDNILIYSRSKKEYPDLSYIKKELTSVLVEMYDKKNKESIYLDGELYKHGYSLQEISSIVRNVQSTKKINYVIYDCFYPSRMDMPYYERNQLLDSIFEKLQDAKYITRAPNYDVHNFDEVDKVFNKVVNDKYEGVIIRNLDAPYTGKKNSVSGTRSKNLVKMKPIYHDEFEVVGYTEGKRGNSKGAVIWIVKTKNGKRLNITPQLSYEERYKLYKDCEKNFVKKYKGRMLTVEYESLSDDGKPLFAKGIAFRDYE